MADDPMKVPAFYTMVARSIRRHPRFWIKLGKVESGLLAPDLIDITVREPVYVCGLARSGSTLLLEVLAAHPSAASHRYQDFPFVFTPFWWYMVLKLSPLKDTSLRERAHGDRMLINAASPEAMEEMLWSSFFPGTHEAKVSQVLGRQIRNPDFADFYEKHIKKLLRRVRGKRYVSKGNYNVTRMGYLRALFQDAKFVVPVRDPVTHIASLMRQHERFCEAGRKDPAVAEHMATAGHYEFGLNRVPINTGDDAAMAEILAAWQRGEEVRGWALYWAMLYRFVADQLEGDADLRSATLVQRFEDLCAQPQESLRALFRHCDMTVDESVVAKYAPNIQKPDYYDAKFSEADLALIREITGPVAARFGY